MWRRRRERVQVGSRQPEAPARAGAPPRPEASGRGTQADRSARTAGQRASGRIGRAWRMDRRGESPVTLMTPPEFARHGTPAGVPAAQVPQRMDGRLGSEMPSVYCTGCGEPNPEGARFCSQCGTPLVRGQGERATETTSIISVGGELAEAESGDDSLTDAATLDALPPGTALLVVRRGPNAGSRFLLDSDLTLIGRHPDSDIFLDDVTVSRRHAEFYRQGGRFTVRDVGSLNGTYVNRERIEEADLSGGDEVQVGKFRLVFLLGPRSWPGPDGGGAQVGG
jgi:FHA domain/zinc-ribbon domain